MLRVVSTSVHTPHIHPLAMYVGKLETPAVTPEGVTTDVTPEGVTTDVTFPQGWNGFFVVMHSNK